MTLSWQISIIDDLIKEDPDATIRDYLACLSEIESITAPNEQDMNIPKHYTTEDAMFILKHYRDFSARHIAARLGLDESVVRNFGSRHKLEFVKGVYHREAPVKVERKVAEPFVRVKGEYSNAGSIQTTQKYAI